MTNQWDNTSGFLLPRNIDYIYSQKLSIYARFYETLANIAEVSSLKYKKVIILCQRNDATLCTGCARMIGFIQ